MVPAEGFAQIQAGEDHEDAQRDDFLDYFQLEGGEFAVADAIGRHLKTIFREGDQPADYDDGEQRRFAVFQVAVPGDGHKDVRANQQQNSSHGAEIVSRGNCRRFPAVRHAVIGSAITRRKR
jgi:hypothetical protein